MKNNQFELWLKSDCIDEETKNRIKLLPEKDRVECFYKQLEFGTGGLRGLIGDGTNRMNLYTVRQATKGLANYLLGIDKLATDKGVAIAYDSRNMSKEFAIEVALTLANSKIKAYLFDDLRTTPELSFSVRALGCAAGVVITASHNPKDYNGYKVYGPDGCQITSGYASGIMNTIKEVDILSYRHKLDVNEALDMNLITYIGEQIDREYICAVKSLSNPEVTPNVNLVYTPIHGTGLMPITRVLSELGYSNVFVLNSQKEPDGSFPTVESPNPEEESALSLAIEYAQEIGADIVLGTDPDCDRVGVAVKHENAFRLLNGNQVGALLINYLLTSGRDIPKNSTVVKTIVTSDLGAMIAKKHGLLVVDTLTGFKYIGEKISEFEKSKTHNFIFGYEESYGYLAGTFVRDKDAVIATTLIAEMASYYKYKGQNLIQVLENIYLKYGYYKEYLKTITLNGIDGINKVKYLMEVFKDRKVLVNCFFNIVAIEDYELSTKFELGSNNEIEIELPKSDVVKVRFDNGSWLAVRPSGTEPKLKFYFSSVGKTESESYEILQDLIVSVDKMINR